MACSKRRRMLCGAPIRGAGRKKMTGQELRQILKMLVSKVDALGYVVGEMEDRGLSEEQRNADAVKDALADIEVTLEDTLKGTVAGW